MHNTSNSGSTTSRRSAHVLGALIAILVIGAAFPASIAQTTLVDVTIQAPYSTDFEDGPADWTALPGATSTRPAPTATWEWGAPTSGPGVAASGSNVWATNIDGLYAANECSGLLSPPIDLSGASSASMGYKQWRHMDQISATSTFVSDAGVLLATTDGGATFTVLTAPDYTTNSLSSVIRPCFDGADTTLRGYTGPPGTAVPAPVYASSSVDLGAFVGQTVQVAFVFASNCCTHRAGWYLDDVAVTINGVTTTEDFETDDGGFTQVGTKVAPPVALGWSYGVPSVGPGNATAMWATNPNGDHGPNECHWVESTSIDLGPLPPEAGAAAKATLLWSQWFRASSVSAAGVVQIGTADGNYTNVVPTTGYGSNPTSSILRACTNHADSGAFAGFENGLGDDLAPFEADITPFLGQTVTVRFLFASTSSTATNEGWYVDDVAVEVALTAVAPNPEDLIPDDAPVGGTDAPGWSHGGVTSWAFGVALSGPVNETVYKTNLVGNYANSECGWIQSPAIPGALVALNPTMKFDQWYEIESLFSTTSYDGGIVMVSVDGGAWTYLSLPEYDRSNTHSTLDTCMVNNGGVADSMVFSGNAQTWETVTVDLTSFASAQSVQFRWLFSSDSSVVYDGWALKNVEIGGVKVL